MTTSTRTPSRARRESLESLARLTAHAGAGQQSRPSTSAVPGYRTDAIVAILDAAATEMSINDVVAALRQAGRDHETYDNVGVDLAYLAERGRVTRVRRGIYASASG
jgi:hypothetical protein